MADTKINSNEDSNQLVQKIVSLCKRRGFVFQSSEIYGGLKSCYDYGPLGVELKRNIAQAWWDSMVYEREDVVGLDASIMMHPKVWETSGHLAGFSDPLVDCLNCKERFRADKATKVDVGTTVEFYQGGKSSGKKLTGVCDRGYVCPQCGSTLLSKERSFNLMFRAGFGPIDYIGQIVEDIEKKVASIKDGGSFPDSKTLRDSIESVINKNAVFLRPETAQAMFVQFLNVVQSTSMHIPFGIAQCGKSFRNEIVTEHFIFRSCEFEQMELEYFVEPGTQAQYLDYWKNTRIEWYRKLANKPDNFRLRRHDKDELAHYSDDCYDIEYLYPWGWDELEGIASRTDYDLSKHSKASNTKLSYFDLQKQDPNTGKQGYRYIPYVIEPSAGLTRSLLCFLLDAYTEEVGVDANGNEKTRVLLKLSPKLAPIKVAVFPLVKKDGLPERARKIAAALRKRRINVVCDDNQSIGKRYAKHDEIGTPYCITVDNQSLEDSSVTVRDRDTAGQVRLSEQEAIEHVLKGLGLELI